MPASPGVKCGFGLMCWLAKSLLCVLTDMCVFVLSELVFLDNLVVCLLSAEKCWRSEKPSGRRKKEGGESEEYQ